MLNKPSDWDSVIALGDYSYATRMNVTYGNYQHTITITDAEIMSGIVLDNRGYQDLSVGNISSTMLEFEAVDIGSKVYMLVPGATIDLYIQVKSGNTLSNSSYMGCFFVDSVVESQGFVKVTAYDALNYIDSIDWLYPITGDVTIDKLNTTAANYKNKSHLPTSVTTDPRLTSLSVPQSNFAGKNYKSREVLGAFFAYGAYNAFLHPKGYSVASDVLTYEISNELTTTEEPKGEVCTVSSLETGDTNTFITGISLTNNNGNYRYNTGWLLNVDMIDAIDISQEMANTIFSNLSSGYGALSCARVEATGAEVSPLIENGDVVSVDNGDGTYTNFKATGYRKVINGKCWCDLFARGDTSNVISIDSSGTSGMTQVSYQTFKPTMEYLGNGIVKFGRYVLTTGSNSPLWVYNSFYASSSFGITYKTATGSQASTSSTACRMLVINRYEPVSYDASTGQYYIDGIIGHVTGIPSQAVEIVDNTLTLAQTNSNYRLYTK